MVLLVAIGSVCAGTDDGLLSDDEDFDDYDGDDFESDDDSDDEDEDEDDSDDDSDDDDSDDDDSDDDDSDDDDLDDEEYDDWDSENESFDGEAGGAFELTTSSLDLSSGKGMNMSDDSYSSADSQNIKYESPKAGNPIFVLLLSLMFLLLIPLRNR